MIDQFGRTCKPSPDILAQVNVPVVVRTCWLNPVQGGAQGPTLHRWPNHLPAVRLTKAPFSATIFLVVLDGELAVPCTRNPP
jgi:hypothetical protein